MQKAICNTWMLHVGRRCELPLGHDGVCGGKSMSENIMNGFDEKTKPIELADYRAGITACRECTNRGDDSIIAAPRFGLGQFNSPKLMVVEQHPDRDVNRCWHGAFGINYKDHAKYADMIDWKQKAMHLVLELLDLTPAEVWATMAVKCPAMFNMPASYTSLSTCSMKHFRREAFTVRPKMILSIGWPPEFLFRYPAIGDPDYRVTYTDTETMCSIVSYSNVVKVHTIDESPAWAHGVVREVKKVWLRCYGQDW